MLDTLVVFLGVTAGFLLNNWAGEQRERRLESRYLHQFFHEIAANQRMLDSAARQDSLWLAHTEPLAGLSSAQLGDDSVLLLVVRQMTQWGKVTPSSITYDDMISSGRLHLVQDDRLRRALLEYYQHLEEFPDLDAILRDYFMDRILPALIQKASMGSGELMDASLTSRIHLHNLFLGYRSIRAARLRLYRSTLTQGDSVLRMLRRR